MHAYREHKKWKTKRVAMETEPAVWHFRGSHSLRFSHSFSWFASSFFSLFLFSRYWLFLLRNNRHDRRPYTLVSPVFLFFKYFISLLYIEYIHLKHTGCAADALFAFNFSNRNCHILPALFSMWLPVWFLLRWIANRVLNIVHRCTPYYYYYYI